MKTEALKKVRVLYPTLPGVPATITRHNRRAWVRSIRALGPRWLLATKSVRQTAYTSS